MRTKTTTTTTNYEKAKAILRENRDLVWMKFYNGYAQSVAVKVIWWNGGADVEKKAKINRLHRRLSRLADYVNEGTLGGDIYGFTR